MDNDNIHSAYRGDIFYADLEPVRGSEQGRRPTGADYSE